MSVHQQDRSISKSTALGCKIDQLLPQLHKEINNLHTDVFEENARLYEEVNRKDDEIKQLKVKLAEVTTSQQEYKEVCMKLRMELIDMRLQIRSCQHSQLQQIAETLKSFRNEDRMSSISESEALSIGQKTHQTSMSVFDDPIQGDATVDVVEEDPVINEKMDEENQMGIQHEILFTQCQNADEQSERDSASGDAGTSTTELQRKKTRRGQRKKRSYLRKHVNWKPFTPPRF